MKFSQKILIPLLIFAWVFSGWPQVHLAVGTISLRFPTAVPYAHAAITASSTIYGAGTHTYIVSTNACSQVVDAWGAGGGGSINADGGTGGGGGAFASSTLALAVGTSHTLAIPAGGAEDTARAAGSTLTTFDTNVVVADGGTAVANGAVTAGGTVANSIGTTRFAGGRGGNGHTTGDEGAGGGGAGGPNADGVDGVDATANVPAGGGASNGATAGKSAAGGAAGSPGNAGTANTTYGGSGGGGGGTNSSGSLGGNPGGGGGSSEVGTGADQAGGDGQITITEYVNDAGCGTAPTVTTNFAGNIGAISATLYGAITDTGGDDAVDHGFAYSTDSALSTSVSTTSLGAYSGAGQFSSFIGSLSNDETYFFRAYAENPSGTGFGSILSFITGNSVPTRSMRLFAGTTVKFFSGRIILYGS